MKYLLAFAAPALIALCLVGLVAAQSPALSAPTGVTVISAADGIRVSWDADNAPVHRVGWANTEELAAARAAGNWLDAFNHYDVTDGNSYLISSLPDGAGYWVIVGSGNASPPTEIAWDEWRLITVEHTTDTDMDTDEAITAAYVRQAIAYYDANGRDATADYYNTEASVQDGRALILVDTMDENRVVSYSTIPALVGESVTGQSQLFPTIGAIVANATAAGAWSTGLGFNRVTGESEPRRTFAVLHEGLVFIASHSALVEDVEAATQEYVNKAIARYEKDGPEATIDYYNSQDSLDGQFYLFLIGADDNYLAHPIFPHLIGSDIKDVEGSDGQRLGEEIAQATEAGIWVEYLWPHPVTRKEQQKVTWAIRYDGLIFASGYYVGAPETGVPPWQNVADPKQYTEDYVNRAIARYQRDGLESVLNYYNSVASFEGQWYLFATDANDIYHVHPLLPHLIGTDIKNLTTRDSEGNPLGESLAAAEDGGEGVWVQYQWPHPVTLKEVTKLGYAKRYKGMLFASGYYPAAEEDLAAQTKAYVQEAIDYYDANGLDAAIAKYSDPDSIGGHWSSIIVDEQGIVRAITLLPALQGRPITLLRSPDGQQVGAEIAAATEAGGWVNFNFPLGATSEADYHHVWVQRHDGQIFGVMYTDDKPGSPEPDDDALTIAYVQKAIAYYDANGLAATAAYYNSRESAEGERHMMIVRAEDKTVLASIIAPVLVGTNTYTKSGTTLGNRLAQATPEGIWYQGIAINPETGQEEPKRHYGIIHDGLIFESGHFIVREDLEGFTKAYVQQAMDYYDANGLDATVAYYDSKDSVEGQFYLFLIGADDIYLAHPIFPHLKGTDIKGVVDSAGYELGQEIAKATTEGHWVDYLWPHPVTRVEEPKSAWVVRHDGLIFASGYYTPDPSQEPPAWQDADPPSTRSPTSTTPLSVIRPTDCRV